MAAEGVLFQDDDVVVDRALLDDKTTVHVGLAELHRRIEDKSSLCSPAGKSHGHLVASAIAIVPASAGCIGDLELALFYAALKKGN
jgi:hypothetical protein